MTTEIETSKGVHGSHIAETDQLQLVTFEVASEEFAVDILLVHEINRMMSLTRVPQSPPEVEGVINLRGKIIPVVDLRRRFGFEPTERDDQSRIIVVEVKDRVIGFIVDRVHEVLRINSNIVDPPPSMISTIDSDFIKGVGKLEDRLIILLEIGRLFGADCLEAADAAAAAAA
ncbi:MAG: chemotaxis protein CheW [Phycisphaeraceae bacterium]|nr:chemotaxis protein CheW [Phycisphaeraceae bacterium]